MTDEQPVELGYLADIPVLQVGPETGESIVIADSGQALRLHERRRPGMGSSILCTVEPITPQRARELVTQLRLDTGSRNVDQVAEQIVSASVEVHVELDYEFAEGSAGTAAARRALLPPESWPEPKPPTGA